jgi:uncharacterized membrane protein YuzA (DUF378 family)
MLIQHDGTRKPRSPPANAVQRLYSTFPGAWPGFALLLLRCAAAVALVACANADALSSASAVVLLVDCAIIVAAALLIGGLWTPVAGIAHALLELYSHICGSAVELNYVLWAIVGLCVAVLGPGACSIDSHLFGRKRIDLRSPSD